VAWWWWWWSSSSWTCTLTLLAQPLRFLDRELFPHIVAVLRRLAAEHLGCSPRRLAPVPNATTGINAVVRSWALKPGDAVFTLSIAYGSVKKLLFDACERAGAELVIADVKFSGLVRCACDHVSVMTMTKTM
jgi:selenocysteine lyase/cysteine desulfurase